MGEMKESRDFSEIQHHFQGSSGALYQLSGNKRAAEAEGAFYPCLPYPCLFCGVGRQILFSRKTQSERPDSRAVNGAETNSL